MACSTLPEMESIFKFLPLRTSKASKDAFHCNFHHIQWALNNRKYILSLNKKFRGRIAGRVNSAAQSCQGSFY